MTQSTKHSTETTVGRAIHEMQIGHLHSGAAGKPVTSRKQAIAIGLSEARRAGARTAAPPKSGSRKS